MSNQYPYKRIHKSKANVFKILFSTLDINCSLALTNELKLLPHYILNASVCQMPFLVFLDRVLNKCDEVPALEKAK